MKSFLYITIFFLPKFNISKLYSDLINQSFHFNFYELLGKRLLSHNIFICVSNFEFDKGYHHHSNYMKPKYEVLIQSFESFLASPEHLCIETPGFPQKIEFCSVSALLLHCTFQHTGISNLRNHPQNIFCTSTSS